MPNDRLTRPYILDRLMDTSIKLNGLAIPAGSIQSSLSRYATAVLVHTDIKEFSLYIRGSGLPVYYRGHYFLVCTKHQLDNVDLERVAMHESERNVVTSAGSRHFISPDPDSDYRDIAAFDFSDPCAAIVGLRTAFFNLTKLPPDRLSSEFAFCVASGYATKDQKYELLESNHLGLVRRSMICHLDGPTADHAVIRLRIDPALEIDPDGLSGGPAFVIQAGIYQSEAFLAGLILRGGREYLHILKVAFITKFLDGYLDHIEPENAS